MFPAIFCQVRHAKNGFSLIELLTAIVILVVLGALTVGGVSRVRSMSNQAVCSSNLRQISTALLTYAQEHDGSFPGPCYGGQKPAYHVATGASNYKMLADYLVPYMDLRQASSGQTLLADPFICPGWVKSMGRRPTDSDITYSAAYKTKLPDGTLFSPFGYPQSGSTPQTNPMRLQQLFDPASLGILWDADANILPAYATVIPAKPVHSLKRNYLFLDGHVECLPLWP